MGETPPEHNCYESMKTTVKLKDQMKASLIHFGLFSGSILALFMLAFLFMLALSGYPLKS